MRVAVGGCMPLFNLGLTICAPRQHVLCGEGSQENSLDQGPGSPINKGYT